jgi:hypothetical protein
MSGSGWIKRRHPERALPEPEGDKNTARGHRHRGSALRASQDDGFVATTITPAP